MPAERHSECGRAALGPPNNWTAGGSPAFRDNILVVPRPPGDDPRVAAKPKIPPIVTVLLCAGLMALLARTAPALSFALPGRIALTIVLAGLGLIVAALGVGRFVRARTTVNPLDPNRASALVTSGIYRLTRNPMYLGLFLVLAAWAVYLAHALPWLVLPLFVFLMNRFQIAPEEAALTELFGQEYREYRQRVRRWL